MKNYLIYLTLIYFTILISCDRNLELTPYSAITNSAFWKSEDDAKGALAGLYAQFRDDVAPWNLYLLGEGRSQVFGNSLAAAVLADFDQNTLTPDNVEGRYGGIDLNWVGIFRTINTCNQIIYYIPKIEYKSQDIKNDILAQAYSMRSYCYFILLRTWGGVPISIEPIGGGLLNLQKPRNSGDEVMALIKEDLNTAISLFPNLNYPMNRATWSYGAANALKASVYLWSGKLMNGGEKDFNEVISACDEIYKTDSYLLNKFGDIFDYENKGNKEIIFSIRRTYQEYKGSTIQSWMYPRENLLPGPIDDKLVYDLVKPLNGAPYWEPSSLTRGIISNDDLRKQDSYRDVYYIDSDGERVFSTSIMTKFNGTVISGQRYFIDDYIVFRLADVILMKAEALNALGLSPANEINKIRKRAFGINYEEYKFIDRSISENDDEILLERYKEMMFEGKRWWDLIRFGKAFELIPSLKDRSGENYLLLFPIPNTTIALNPELQQNPGY